MPTAITDMRDLGACVGLKVEVGDGVMVVSRRGVWLGNWNPGNGSLYRRSATVVHGGGPAPFESCACVECVLALFLERAGELGR